MAKEEREVVILTSADEPAWKAYSESHPAATIYHTLAWRDVLYNEYRYEPLYLMAKEGGRVIGIMPMFLVKNMRGRKLVSLPFSIYGGPLGDREEALTALLRKTLALLHDKKARCVEIRPQQEIAVNESLGFQAQQWGVGTMMDLTKGKEALWSGMNERFNVNKAAKKGLTFSVTEGEKLDEFYRLQLMTRKRQGLPTPRIAYYASFFSRMPGMVKLAFAEKDGKAIAGDMFFVFRGKVLLVLNVSDRKYANYKANDYMIWNIIKWCCEAGFTSLDHGPIPYADKGLLHFKKKWGGDDVQALRYYCPPAAAAENKPKSASALIKAMPTRMASKVGHILIKSLA